VNVKFLKITSAEVDNGGEIVDRTFYHNEVLMNVQVDRISSNYSNLFLETGEIVLVVPNNTYQVI
jgi:hypothetical protein